MLYSCPLILSKSVSYPRYNLVKHSINSTDPSFFSSFFSSSFSFSSFFSSQNTFTKKRKNPVNIIVLTWYSIKRTSSLDPRICIERVSRPPGALRHLSILGPALSSRTPRLSGAVAEFSTSTSFHARGEKPRERRKRNCLKESVTRRLDTTISERLFLFLPLSPCLSLSLFLRVSQSQRVSCSWNVSAY